MISGLVKAVRFVAAHPSGPWLGAAADQLKVSPQVRATAARLKLQDWLTIGPSPQRLPLSVLTLEDRSTTRIKIAQVMEERQLTPPGRYRLPVTIYGSYCSPDAMTRVWAEVKTFSLAGDGYPLAEPLSFDK